MRNLCLAVDPPIISLAEAVLADLASQSAPADSADLCLSPPPEEHPLPLPLQLARWPPVTAPSFETPPSTPELSPLIDPEMPILQPYEDEGVGPDDLDYYCDSPGSFTSTSSTQPPSPSMVLCDGPPPEDQLLDQQVPSIPALYRQSFELTDPNYDPSFVLDYPVYPGVDCKSCAYFIMHDGSMFCSLCHLRLACSPG